MQPSRGETSSRAQAPQKVNRQAMEIISRLSVERCFIIHFISGITIYKIYEPTEVLNHVYTNPYLYSAVYNGSFLAIDMVLCLIIFAILYKPLKRYITAQDLDG